MHFGFVVLMGLTTSPLAAVLSAIAVVFLASPGSVFAQGEEDSFPGVSGIATRTNETITVDGLLDESSWDDAPLLRGFVQAEPSEGAPASERTEIRVLFDDDALYVGAWLYDTDPTAIIVGETRRDADLADADALLFVLDTYLDRQNGFVFGTTPAAIEYDGQVTREGQGGSGGQFRATAGSGGGFNVNWDGSWDVATHRDGQGWYAEFRIPFTTLRYAGGGPQVWGLNFSRTIRRKNEEVFWAPIPRQYNLWRISQAGTLTGLEAPSTRTLTATPYVLTSGSRDYRSDTEARGEWDVGGDAKIGLTPSLTLDLTVKTDFAQVEVDDQQVNLTRFSLFFPEKRPFFLENAGTFAVGSPQDVELFFSRRIGIDQDTRAAVPILAGGRVSGKVGKTTVGLLNIQTEDVTVASGDSTITVPKNNYGVLRLLRELPNRSRLGAIFVSRINADDASDHNYTYGVDGRLGVGEALSFEGYIGATSTPGLNGDDLVASASGSYSSRTWEYGFLYRHVGEDFNPEVGFLPRTDYRFTNVRLLRKFRFEDAAWFRELRPHMSYRENRALDGFLETGVLHMDSHFEFSNGAFFQLPAINYTIEGLADPFEIATDIIIPPGTYHNWEWGFRANTNLSAPVSLEGRIDIGGFYSGHRYNFAPEVTARFGETAVVGLNLQYADVHLPEGDFTRTVLRLRTAYSFTPRLYVQGLVQYNNTTKDVTSNVRLGWLSTAGTGLFVVFNDTEHRGPFARTGFDSGPVNRTLVLKFTRQFDLGR